MPDPLQKELISRAIKKTLSEDHGDLALPKVEVFDLEGAGPTLVPRPHQFQPYPDVRGGTHLANQVNDLLKFAPSLQGHIKKVQYGPNRDVLDQIANDDDPKATHFKGHDFPNTSLLGLTNINTGDIALNPTLSDNDEFMELVRKYSEEIPDTKPALNTTAGILAHEAAHTLGYGDRIAYTISDSIKNLFGGRLPK